MLGNVGDVVHGEGVHGGGYYTREILWPETGEEIQMGAVERRFGARELSLPHGSGSNPNVQRKRGLLFLLPYLHGVQESKVFDCFQLFMLILGLGLHFEQVYQLSIGAACGLSWPSDRIIVQVLDDSTDPIIKVISVHSKDVHI